MPQRMLPASAAHAWWERLHSQSHVQIICRAEWGMQVGAVASRRVLSASPEGHKYLHHVTLSVALCARVCRLAHIPPAKPLPHPVLQRGGPTAALSPAPGRSMCA